jgi:hypothetical protein
MVLRRRRLSLILIILALMVSGLTLRARSARQRAFYSKPHEVKLEWTAKKLFRDYHRNYPGQNFLVENFYPIGWSKDGKFAYYAEPVDEACGCYFAKLRILDLKTDKVLWSFDYEGDGSGEARKSAKPYSFDTLWRANRKLFSDKLREHAIEPQGRAALLSFPIHHKGDRLTADLKLKEKENATEEERLYGVVSRSTLQFYSRRSGKKTILDSSYPEWRPLHVGILGYVKSPFEPRVAVILVEINRGYEGPPHVGRVKIAGAHLETGFK